LQATGAVEPAWLREPIFRRLGRYWATRSPVVYSSLSHSSGSTPASRSTRSRSFCAVLNLSASAKARALIGKSCSGRSFGGYSALYE